MRISGVNIPDNKKVKISLTYIYGVGFSLTDEILKATKINPDKKTKELTSEEVNKIQNYIEKNFKAGGELRQIIKQNIQRLKDLRCYRGVRHIRKMPLRGQRTRRNTRTIRGNVRRTVGSGKRKTELK